jgi:hypothetical protein
MDSIASPHDTFFRESFTRQEVARDFLRCQLPAALLAQLDLTTLTISKDTYVASDLRTAYSDLVYRVGYRGEALNVYLLFEHESRAEQRALDRAPAPALHRRRGRAVPKTASQGPAPAAGLPAGDLPRRPALAGARDIPRPGQAVAGQPGALRAELRLPAGGFVRPH